MEGGCNILDGVQTIALSLSRYSVTIMAENWGTELLWRSTSSASLNLTELASNITNTLC